MSSCCKSYSKCSSLKNTRLNLFNFAGLALPSGLGGLHQVLPAPGHPVVRRAHAAARRPPQGRVSARARAQGRPLPPRRHLCRRPRECPVPARRPLLPLCPLAPQRPRPRPGGCFRATRLTQRWWSWCSWWWFGRPRAPAAAGPGRPGDEPEPHAVPAPSLWPAPVPAVLQPSPRRAPVLSDYLPLPLFFFLSRPV